MVFHKVQKPLVSVDQELLVRQTEVMRDAGGASEVPIFIDRFSEESLPTQLAAALRAAIDNGVLRPGEPIPATRGLASRLGVARGVVVSAYEQLIAEGYLEAGHGRGTIVSPHLPLLRPPLKSGARADSPHGADQKRIGQERTGQESADTGASGRFSREPTQSAHLPGPLPLTPGVPDTNALDRPPWRTAWRTALAQTHFEVPALGDPRLRWQIAEHLRRMRGTDRDAEDVIIAGGAREGLGLVLSSLRRSDGRQLRIGVEDPGYPSLRRVVLRSGAQIVPLPVDTYGPNPTPFKPGTLDAIIVTPSHQYPLGGSLPLVRRHELLAWAAQSAAVIIEDDYDSELRYVGNPLPTLAALDDPVDGVIVLLGTFSTTIARGLSAGYLLAPQKLRRVIEPVRNDTGGVASALVQAALAQYMESGELRRHTARMRRRYGRSRMLVAQKLGDLPGVQVRPMSGGLNAVLDFGSDPVSAAAEARVVAAVARAGLGGVALNQYWQSNREDAQHGLVIGIGATSRLPPNTLDFEGALLQLRKILEEELGEQSANSGG